MTSVILKQHQRHFKYTAFLYDTFDTAETIHLYCRQGKVFPRVYFYLSILNTSLNLIHNMHIEVPATFETFQLSSHATYQQFNFQLFFEGAGGQTIIFTNTKAECDNLITSNCFGQLKTQVLHGDIGQNSRQITIKQFKDVRIF